MHPPKAASATSCYIKLHQALRSELCVPSSAFRALRQRHRCAGHGWRSWRGRCPARCRRRRRYWALTGPCGAGPARRDNSGLKLGRSAAHTSHALRHALHVPGAGHGVGDGFGQQARALQPAACANRGLLKLCTVTAQLRTASHSSASTLDVVCEHLRYPLRKASMVLYSSPQYRSLPRPKQSSPTSVPQVGFCCQVSIRLEISGGSQGCSLSSGSSLRVAGSPAHFCWQALASRTPVPPLTEVTTGSSYLNTTASYGFYVSLACCSPPRGAPLTNNGTGGNTWGSV